MSMPNVALPWSVAPHAITPLQASRPETDVASIAAALYAAGFAQSAFALTDAVGDAQLQALADSWRQTQVLDDATALMIGRGSGPVVPSVSARDDGAPRFVLCIPDGDAAARAIASEHGGDGVSAELRLFLDEALRNGDRYVDAATGDGFAALSAATGDAAVSVIALCDDAAHCDAIERSARWSGAADAVETRIGDSLDAIAFAPALPGASTVVHAGSAAAVAQLLTGARAALERREIGAVAWRCGRADETSRDAESLQVAAAVLGVFGFVHFALTNGEFGTELVPADAMASNEMIFSLEPSFLARFAS